MKEVSENIELNSHLQGWACAWQAGTCGISPWPEPGLTAANTAGPGSPAAAPACLALDRQAEAMLRQRWWAHRGLVICCAFSGADKELLPHG